MLGIQTPPPERAVEPPKCGGLLDDYCREAPVRGGEGSHHAGAAASDHDDVVLLCCHVEHVIELPGSGATGPVTTVNEGTSAKCSSVAVRDELAADLAQAERSREPIAPLTAGYPDIDVVDAYEIQLINIRQRVAEGARVVGHKVGLSSEAMQQMMGVDEPDYGHLLDEMEVFEDVPVKAGRYLYPAGRGRGRVHPGRRPAGRRTAPRTTCWQRPRPSSRRSN